MTAIAAPRAIPLSKWLVFIRPSLAGFDRPLTKKRIMLLGTALLCFGCSQVAQALTVIIYVNPSTWAITSWSGDFDAEASTDYHAIKTDYYNNQYHRYYTFGSFDTVVIERDDTHATLQTLSPCNNIFYIDRSTHTAYTCSTGGSNGTNGRIRAAAAFNNGDLYIGGDFTQAGSVSNTSYFSCFRWSEGWSGVGGVYTDGSVSSFSYDGSYRLVVSGSFSHIYGPFSSGGTYTSSSVSGTAYWKEWHYAFTSDYWEY